MKYINHLTFVDIMDRFKWYPKPFRLIIFCKDNETIDLFEKEIDKYDIIWLRKDRMKDRRCYQKENHTQIIDIIKLTNNFCCGQRANAIIFDSHYPSDVVCEVILPMANIEPSYGGLAYQKATLEKDLNGIRTTWQDYEIDLEEETNGD